ncbi:NAD-dependent succinate-semialdehyde dehydrogenase [Paenibacillus sp. 598K]|uniref:NAD-dependent succinate-semialdehyde dehydrogenase n=1 Tax=Paenibacillus sp. 598K TaxID=1117987 RepID=UPI000FF99C1A|nr:NAD-dependent succinate-semialdehyde dehydrogenase [Paenibacillus sp. 598K]GBF76585.1 NAD-dependent succinate-semialdehyde dehydrogenase [Paenibacillus sp. 598K]
MDTNLYINGEWIGAEKRQPVENPATLEVVGSIAYAGAAEATAAVDAAYAAGPAWRRKTASERAALLLRWHHLIEQHKAEVGRIMTLEQGKPLPEAIGEMTYAGSFLTWFAEEGKRVYGQSVPASAPDKRILVTKQPVGVVAAITPWNFPAAMLTRKVAPALAAGCTVVVKPSEFTPLTAYKLVELAHEAGIPAGVLNVIAGDAAAIGETWMADPRVSKLSFTGSTRVGKLLYRQAADTVKKLSLELGGHAPYIVTANADLAQAAKDLMAPKFRNAGQTCICPNRVYVHESVHDAFVAELTQAMSTIKVGNGLEEGSTVGPLINKAAVEKMNRHVGDAVEHGATVAARVQAPEGPGYFVEPAVLTGVTDEMLCMREETFGPLLPVTTYQTTEEVIRRANDSRYGLSAYVFTQDLKEAFEISEGLEYGIVGLNDGLPATAQAPFGGMKESGLGREGGHWGIEEFLEVKYVSLKL